MCRFGIIPSPSPITETLMIAPQNQICIYFQYSEGKIYAYASDGISDGPVLVGQPAKEALGEVATSFGLDLQNLIEDEHNSRLTTFIGVPSQ